MPKYILRYVDIKEKVFNKKSTLQKFIDNKIYKVVEVYEKKGKLLYSFRNSEHTTKGL